MYALESGCRQRKENRVKSAKSACPLTVYSYLIYEYSRSLDLFTDGLDPSLLRDENEDEQ